MDGIINIYKEKGFTSHDVVAVVRKTINQKKVGHTGTLDPDATGVLPICIGRGTKLSDYIMAAEKEYLAEVTFGITTTTEDASGDILEQKKVVFNEKDIKKAVGSFVGEIEQIPPMYSAIKIDGKKLYQLAREGKEIERKTRKVEIKKIEILEFLPPNKIKISVTCSKGTYIRTLCKDIGEKLGFGAHMSSLERTRSGAFIKENAITLTKLKTLKEESRLNEVVLPMEKALESYGRIFVNEKADKLIHNGCKIYSQYFEKTDKEILIGETVTAYDSKGMLVGIFTIIEDDKKVCIKPLKILL